MAIIAEMRTPQFAWGRYHRIRQVDTLCKPDEPNPRYVIHLEMHHNHWTRKDGFPPICINKVEIPFNELLINPLKKLYELSIQRGIFADLEAILYEENTNEGDLEMAIIAQCVAPNFARGEYHRMLRAETLCSPSEENPRHIIYFGHYYDKAARDANSEPMYVNQVVIPFSTLEVDPRDEWYELAMTSPLFANANPVSDVAPEPESEPIPELPPE